MDEKLLVTTVVTIFLAFIGYLVTYLNNLRLAQRKERLERVNRQLSELYGPLFALTEAADKVYVAFRNKVRPNQSFFRESPPPTEEDLKAWRQWMTGVFMPINNRLYELILTKSDLLIESKMPDVLLWFCAHVASYQMILKQWEEQNYSEHEASVYYPSKQLLKYSKESFSKLKEEQANLLGKTNNN